MIGVAGRRYLTGSAGLRIINWAGNPHPMGKFGGRNRAPMQVVVIQGDHLSRNPERPDRIAPDDSGMIESANRGDSRRILMPKRYKSRDGQRFLEGPQRQA
ncbi:uncharacterized protein LDX57_004909 [Aspergillus melleus]|uniref:uncharacterized protein n=1 Tax=Aspergillus melleus TaxID=138277 RepID=UPI001E8E8493|nr:uncharacterized protein LDX57_004909 [Aspergillus melleus]KAH8427194.1 hypothetical protein LDX57_004909 [Aspergillus melleus]